MSVCDLLKSLRLDKYQQAVAKAGYLNLEDLSAANEEDLVQDVGMSLPHARRVVRHFSGETVRQVPTTPTPAMSATSMASSLFNSVPISTSMFSSPAPQTSAAASTKEHESAPAPATPSLFQRFPQMTLPKAVFSTAAEKPEEQEQGGRAAASSLLSIPGSLFAAGGSYLTSASPPGANSNVPAPSDATTPTQVSADMIVDTDYGEGVLKETVYGEDDLCMVELGWSLYGDAPVITLLPPSAATAKSKSSTPLGSSLAQAESLARNGIGKIGAAAGTIGLAFSIGFEAVRDTTQEYQKQRHEKAEEQKNRREDKERRKRLAQQAHSNRKREGQSQVDKAKEERQRERDEEEREKRDPSYLKQPQKPLGEIMDAMKTLEQGGLMSDIWAGQEAEIEILAAVLQFVHQICEGDMVVGTVEELPLKAWHVRGWSDVLHISKQAPYVVVLTSTSFFRVTYSKSNRAVKSYIRVPMQDVASVYMTTKKNQKCMTLLMAKEDGSSTRVGQLAGLATAAVSTAASAVVSTATAVAEAARVLKRGTEENGAVGEGLQEEDYFVHTPFYLTPQEQRAYTQEMIWAFQQVHRRFATSPDTVKAISPELVHQVRQSKGSADLTHPEAGSMPGAIPPAAGSPKGCSCSAGSSPSGSPSGGGGSKEVEAAAAAAAAAIIEEEAKKREEEERRAASEAAAEAKKREEEEAKRNAELEAKTQEIKESEAGAASSLFAEVDLREKMQGKRAGKSLFGEEADSPRGPVETAAAAVAGGGEGGQGGGDTAKIAEAGETKTKAAAVPAPAPVDAAVESESATAAAVDTLAASDDLPEI